MLQQATRRALSSGRWHQLGATLTGDGVNFALYSEHATEVWLLLFDDDAGPASDVIRVEERTRHIWHVHVSGVGAGQRYGYKVGGPFEPWRGLRFNDAKLLLDPYAKAITGKPNNTGNLLLGYDAASPARDTSLDRRDSTEVMARALVVDDAFDWQGDVAPDLPLEQLVLYEVHARGFTAHPSSGVQHPGTYLGFIDKIPYLQDLGVNAVELLPIHEIYVEDFLRGRGLTNYWGYSTLGFFAPEIGYSTRSSPGCAVTEWKTMVRALHRAGIEVILDVVFNHTAEGNEHGPTLSWKGIDNPTYYCLTGPPGETGRHYVNYTGCGNSLNLGHRQVIRMVMDSLRYWTEEMHVDGFRFDLASVLGREDGRFHASASFFDAVAQDPVLQRVKLIAEPWDLGTYQVGNFPVDWSEWNGRFRDSMRRFGKGDHGVVPDVAARLTGSADLYADDGRSAYNSINFITCHDGFTLHDLVAYNHKHNQANGEDNRDGTDDNHSWNCGVEGETTDPAVLRLRSQLAKNHFCHLLFSLGTPMILGGDEFLRTQGGNNNAYCQDNELGWFDWDRAEAAVEMRDFVRRAIAFNQRYTILHRRKFHLGRDTTGEGVADITWFGTELQPPAWGDHNLRLLCYQLDGAEERSAEGAYRLFVILNPDSALHDVRLPRLPSPMQWRRVVDTSLPHGEDFTPAGHEPLLEPADRYLTNPRSTVVLLARPC